MLNQAELGSSWQGRSAERPGWLSSAVEVACVQQSDEGGRFFQAICHYRLLDLGNMPEEAPEGCWLSLGEMGELLGCDGWLTNEARTLISLLLYWL